MHRAPCAQPQALPAQAGSPPESLFGFVGDALQAPPPAKTRPEQASPLLSQPRLPSDQTLVAKMQNEKRKTKSFCVSPAVGLCQTSYYYFAFFALRFSFLWLYNCPAKCADRNRHAIRLIRR